MLLRLPLEEGGHVGRAGDRHGAAVEAVLDGDARQGRVTAVARADDARALRIDHALGRQGGDPIGDIGQHLAAPFAVAGVLEGQAAPEGAAVIGLEHSVAA